MNGKRLSIAVIIEALDIFAWQYSALKSILTDEENDIGLVIINNDRAKIKNKASTISQKCINKIQALNRSLVGVISGLPGLRANIGVYKDAFAVNDIRSLISNAKLIQSEVSISDVKGNIFSTEIIMGIKSADIDLVIDFCGLDSYEGVLQYIRYGIYVYKYGLFNDNTSFVCGVHESLFHIYATWFKLRFYAKQLSQGVEIYRESISTHRLAACNTNNLMWTSAGVIFGQLELLKLLGVTKYIEVNINNLRNIELPCKGNTDNVLLLSLMNACSYVKYVFQSLKDILFYYQWFLFLVKKNDFNQSNSLQQIVQLVPGTDRFWADPFIVVQEDYIYIFVEEEIRSSRKGHISVIKLDPAGKFIDVRSIIVMDYHMSYPFLFNYSNEMYMVPETSQDNSIKLYKCTAFPEHWQFVKTLLTNIKAVDTSIIYYNGLWWMFLGKYCEDGSHNRLLYLYYAEDLFSEEWTSHILNPIVRDIRGARNAGRIFVCKGNLYRPSQDCSKSYGCGIRIKKIIDLSTTEYTEVEVSSIDTDNIEGVSGIHTINAEKDLFVIDSRKGIFRFSKKSRFVNTKMIEQKMNDFTSRII